MHRLQTQRGPPPRFVPRRMNRHPRIRVMVRDAERNGKLIPRLHAARLRLRMRQMVRLRDRLARHRDILFCDPASARKARQCRHPHAVRRRSIANRLADHHAATPSARALSPHLAISSASARSLCDAALSLPAIEGNRSRATLSDLALRSS